MKGHLLMSQKERQRHVVLDRLTKDELRPFDASKILGVSYRHVQRMALAYRALGAASLVHGLRGRPGRHSCPAQLKESVLAAFRSNHKDFGPTLASKKLAENDVPLAKPETLRLWLMSEGDWFPKKRRGHHRCRRYRCASFGDLIQVDGSHHDWFEKRGDRCCLMTMVDGATGRTFLLFTEDEGTLAVMATLRGWIETYGVPMALYTDRLKTYLTDREATIAEQLAGEEPLTQFGRACASLDIRIIGARSPQAKGRVENKHGLTQDRLVKELRLAGINTIDAATAEMIYDIFILDKNRTFSFWRNNGVEMFFWRSLSDVQYVCRCSGALRVMMSSLFMVDWVYLLLPDIFKRLRSPFEELRKMARFVLGIKMSSSSQVGGLALRYAVVSKLAFRLSASNAALTGAPHRCRPLTRLV